MIVSSHQRSKAKQVFLHMVELDSQVERAQYLERACADDSPLRQLVEDMALAESKTSPMDWMTSQFTPAPQTFDSLRVDVENQPLIGPYKLLEQIGEGGMGVVYLAIQQQPISRMVALKLIKPGMNSKQVVARFEAERQALAMMNHPNIAKVLDAGSTETGLPYFVMELVRGTPITKYCDTHKLDLRQRLELLIKVCEAVQHAHQKGIIHRDLKPSNLLVELDEVRAIPKVIDFGIAKAMQQPLAENTVYTGVAQMLGTPLYMSPEQAQLDSLDVDVRSDIYSLGVLLYELLTGSTPFDSETLKRADFDERRRIIREEEPPRPSQRISTMPKAERSTAANKRGLDERTFSKCVSSELDWITLKALEKDRTRRYESSSALAADIQRFLRDEAVLACPPSSTYRLRKFARRYRASLLTATAIATILVGATIVSSSLALWALDERREALDSRSVATQQEQLARQQRDVAEYNSYVATIKFADSQQKRGDSSFESLGSVVPEVGRPDFRGWELNYLYSQIHSQRLTLPFQVERLAWGPDGKKRSIRDYRG